jgi:hypothetical protein
MYRNQQRNTEEQGRCKEHYLEYLLNLQAVLYVGGGMSVPHILLQNLRKKILLKTTFNIKRL